MMLSTFSGIGMLDEAFREELGECIVSSGDLIWGEFYDIKRFHPPRGVFFGVIGGPPCQSFSSLVHLVRATGYEPRFGNLIPEFERVVAEAQPRWFLMENVTGAPSPAVDGYTVREQVLNNRWFGAEQNRVRRFCFGSLDPSINPWAHLEVALFEPYETYVTVSSNVGGYSSEKAKERHTVTHGNGFGSTAEYYKRQSTAVVSDLRDTPVKVGGSGKVKRRVSGSVTAAHGGGLPRPKGQMVRYSLADACELQGLPLPPTLTGVSRRSLTTAVDCRL